MLAGRHKLMPDLRRQSRKSEPNLQVMAITGISRTPTVDLGEVMMKHSRMIRNGMLAGVAALALAPAAYGQAVAGSAEAAANQPGTPAAESAPQPAAVAQTDQAPATPVQTAQVAATAPQARPAGQIVVTGVRQPYIGSIPI